ncbi:MAG: GNAT family N-acetyltransferase [Acidimicrobiales bacterium]
MAHDVRRDDERGRYELVVDDQVVSYADFRDTGESVVFPHTVTLPEHRGNGYADILVAAALDDVRAQGRTVVPTCWFVADFIASRPDYADLLAS